MIEDERLEDVNVIVRENVTGYPDSYYPPKIFPEFRDKIAFVDLDPENQIYSNIREILYELGLDKENYNSSKWNPMKDLISPGDKVVIKPNFVKHNNENKKGSIDELITNPSILKPLIDYVALGLNFEGTIIIGDAPIQQADFKEIMDILEIYKMKEEYSEFPNLSIQIIDFRRERAFTTKFKAIKRRVILDGDPEGSIEIDLKSESLHQELSDGYENFRVTQYDKDKMKKAHNKTNHKYLIAASVLDADLFISLPKLKTHRKAGFTNSLKNIVGINALKDYLPHHRKGSLKEGGDEYKFSSLRKKIISNLNERMDNTSSMMFKRLLYFIKVSMYASSLILKFKDPYFEGSWWGNDTIPRTITDLNKILLFANKNGDIVKSARRKTLTITDAVISGHEEGPLKPSPIKSEFLVASKNFVANDLVATRIIGFDYRKIPIFIYALDSKNGLISTDKKLSNITIKSHQHGVLKFSQLRDYYNIKFKPSSGWKNHVELLD